MKLCAETGDLVLTYKLGDAAVGLCRHDVGIGDGFSWKWSNDNELWDSVLVRNLFARRGNFSCLAPTAAVGQQFVDREVGVFYVKMLEMFKKVTGAVHDHDFHHQLRAVEDNADGNGFNSSVQPYAVAVHSDSSWHAADEVFLQLAGNTVDEKSRRKPYVYIDAWRNVSTDPIENDYLAVRDEISLESPDEYFDSGSFMPRVGLLQHGLSDHDVPRHRWRYFPKMQMDDVLSFEQFDLDAALPGHVSFHAASADPKSAIPDAPVGQSMECHVLPFVPHSEPNSLLMQWRRRLPFHAERGAWNLSLVRELYKWTRNDVYSEVPVGRMFVNLGMKFAEMACRNPATTAVIVDMTVLRTPREEWKHHGNSAPNGPYGRLSLNSRDMPVRLQFAEPNLDVSPTSETSQT